MLPRNIFGGNKKSVDKSVNRWYDTEALRETSEINMGEWWNW